MARKYNSLALTPFIKLNKNQFHAMQDLLNADPVALWLWTRMLLYTGSSRPGQQYGVMQIEMPDYIETEAPIRINHLGIPVEIVSNTSDIPRTNIRPTSAIPQAYPPSNIGHTSAIPQGYYGGIAKKIAKVLSANTNRVTKGVLLLVKLNHMKVYVHGRFALVEIPYLTQLEADWAKYKGIAEDQYATSFLGNYENEGYAEGVPLEDEENDEKSGVKGTPKRRDGKKRREEILKEKISIEKKELSSKNSTDNEKTLKNDVGKGSEDREKPGPRFEIRWPHSETESEELILPRFKEFVMTSPCSKQKIDLTWKLYKRLCESNPVTMELISQKAKDHLKLTILQKKADPKFRRNFPSVYSWLKNKQYNDDYYPEIEALQGTISEKSDGDSDKPAQPGRKHGRVSDQFKQD